LLTVNKATPTITWATPAAITYGTALSATQLNATASVNGSFAYNPPAGTVLGAGTQTLSVTFTPSDTTDYATVTQTVQLTVNQATPTVTWATPAAITYGTALSGTQLDATASVSGTFAYTPAAGTVLGAGTHTLSVSFAPTDTTDYTSPVIQTVQLTVNPAALTVTWATPAAITYGTALSGTQLDATASVSGTFAYTPAAGTVLGAGTHTLSVSFTPTDTTDYTTATQTVQLTVNQATPAVTWATPAAITYGTALSSTQLNASASVNGTFVYTPPAGTVPGAGTQTLSVTFTPTDTTDYATVTQTALLTVNKATPTITWATPAAITYGTALSATQLNASAGVNGSFAYNPPAGTVLGAGTQTLSVTFTPGDTTDYATVTQTVQLTVNQATPTVTWTAPAAITYGSALSATQLNASASVNGNPVYTPPAGTVLGAGTQTLSVTFTPSDTTDYATVTQTVQLTVNQATPTLTWAAPAAITYGTALSATQLNASASVNGNPVYTPPAGTVLGAGTQTLSVTFTPGDTTDYATVTQTVSLTVNKATPTVTWAAPAAITYGTALSATQLNASAGVNGNLVYTPPAGTVLGAGTQTLSVTFTPGDTTDYATVTQAVSLTVNKATPTVTWAAPAAITYGTALSATQLNAGASVNGNLVYNPPAGAVLTAGSQTLSVTFTPGDTTDYTSPITQSVSLTVNQATPVVTWAAPAAIIYGTPLSGTQLDATANVNGKFVYNPPAGTLLGVGSYTLSVTFTPSDTTDYTSPVIQTVSLTVNPVTGIPVTVNYSTPSPATIYYGTALVARQMKVSVTVEVKGKSTTITGDGTISFTDTTPVAGQAVTAWTAANTDVVLPAGPHSIVATWTPGAGYSQYAVGYSGAQTIQVNPYAPVLTFKPASGTQYPESFAGTNILLTTTATATVAGSKGALDGAWAFTDVCTPVVAGTPCGGPLSTDGSGQLVAGSHLITASFTPADTNDYTAGAVSKTITVKQGKLSFTGTVGGPTALVYGTGLPPALFNAVINHYDDVAKAEVPESASNVCTNGIVYTDSATGSAVNASEVLPAGSYTIDVSCTSPDANDYPSPAVAREKLKVTPLAVVSLLTFQPAAMEHGTATGAAQTTGAVNQLPIVNPNNQEVINCAWTFSPPEGTLEKRAGAVTVKATCTPQSNGVADTNYTKGTVSAQLTVN